MSFVRRYRNSQRVRPGYWFRPKTFGWGAVPVTWQGWLVTVLFMTAAAIVGNVANHRGPTWLVLLVPLTLGFILLCWTKTDGGWSFHWGDD